VESFGEFDETYLRGVDARRSVNGCPGLVDGKIQLVRPAEALEKFAAARASDGDCGAGFESAWRPEWRG
jgi:hypothetical protein